jgi:hypothetical protein
LDGSLALWRYAQGSRDRIALTELGLAQRSRRGRFKEPSQGSCLIIARSRRRFGGLRAGRSHADREGGFGRAPQELGSARLRLGARLPLAEGNG